MGGIIIIGSGNTLRRDRGAGVAAAEKIAGAFPETGVATTTRLTGELAEAIAQSELAVFIAASTRTTSVCVTRVGPGGESPEGDEGELSPAGLIALAAGRFDAGPEEALLIEIPAFECGFGERLSARTRGMIDTTFDLVAELLRGETTPELLLCLEPSPADD